MHLVANEREYDHFYYRATRTKEQIISESRRKRKDPLTTRMTTLVVAVVVCKIIFDS